LKTTTRAPLRSTATPRPALASSPSSSIGVGLQTDAFLFLLKQFTRPSDGTNRGAHEDEINQRFRFRRSVSFTFPLAREPASQTGRFMSVHRTEYGLVSSTSSHIASSMVMVLTFTRYVLTGTRICLTLGSPRRLKRVSLKLATTKSETCYNL